MLRKDIPLADLKLNLNHCRHAPQPDEESALRELIAADRAGFTALGRSLVESGFFPTEMLLVVATSSGAWSVADGNRRVAALKAIHGLLRSGGSAIPRAPRRVSWREDTRVLPCLVFPESRSDAVATLVTRIHNPDGVGRAPWSSLAKARFARASGERLPILEMLGAHFAKRTKPYSREYDFALLTESLSRAARVLRLPDAETLAKRYGGEATPQLDALMTRIGDDLTFSRERLVSDPMGWLLDCGFITSPLPEPFSGKRPPPGKGRGGPR